MPIHRYGPVVPARAEVEVEVVVEVVVAVADAQPAGELPLS